MTVADETTFAPAALAASAVGKGWRTSTPQRIRFYGTVLIALFITLAVSSTAAILVRQGAASESAATSAPGLVDAQVAYTSLSDADTTAAGNLLVGPSTPPVLRLRYQTDVARASAALADAARLSGAVTGAAAPLRTLNVDVPLYAGLIQIAQTNNRLGYPVAAAYLSEASNLMHTRILVAAGQLYRAEEGRLAADQRSGVSRGLLVLSGIVLVGVLVALFVVQSWLRARFRRRVNVPLLVSTGLVLIAAIWVGLAVTAQSRAVNDATNHGTVPLSALTEARILALQARSDDELTLVTRDSVGTYQADYPGVASHLASIVSGEPRSGARSWVALLAAVHDQIRNADNSGNPAAAIAYASDNAPTDLPAVSKGLDDALTAGIASAESRFYSSTSDARADLMGLSWGLPIICAACVLLLLIGLRPRLREYR